MRKTLTAFLFCLSLAWPALAAKPEIEKPLVIAHYMAWFGVPEQSGDWFQWKFALESVSNDKHHYPDLMLASGRHDVAAVHYPAIGPYDSTDPNLCEYHILLAKQAGIDAFMVNWYGFETKEGLRRQEDKGFEQLLKAAEKLDFKVCLNFDDKSVFPPYYNFSKREQAVAQAKKTFERVMKSYGTSPAYLKIKNKPVLSNFGWAYVNSDSIDQTAFSVKEWKEILSSIKPRPFFLHDHQWDWGKTIEDAGFWDFSESIYSWIGHADDRKEFLAESQALLKKKKLSMVTATVNPGFDNTPCWGWGGGLSQVLRRDGAEYITQWMEAENYKAGIVQIATWNDFTEGSTIEPTEEYGNLYLKITADFVNKLSGRTDLGRSLDLPKKIYQMRARRKKLNKGLVSSPTVMSAIDGKLDRAVNLFLLARSSEIPSALAEVELVLQNEEKRSPKTEKLKITLGPASQDIFGGEKASVTLKVKNISADSIPVYVEMNRSSIPRSWMENLEAPVWLKPGEQRDLNYVIRVPSNAQETTGWLTAAVDSPYLSQTSNVSYVRIYRPFLRGGISGVNLLEAGKEHVLNLNLDFRQRMAQSMKLAADLPAGWEVRFDKTDLDLPAAGKITIPIYLKVPDDAWKQETVTVNLIHGSSVAWSIKEPFGILSPAGSGLMEGDIDQDGVKDYVLSNREIEVHVTPAIGGRILGLINRKTVRNQLHLSYSALPRKVGDTWDKWMEYGGINEWFPGDWPGKVWNNNWDAAVQNHGNGVASVLLSCKADEDLTISKEIQVDLTSSKVKVLYEIQNIGRSDRVVFWTNHPDLAPGWGAGEEDHIIVPMTDGTISKKEFVPRLQKTNFIPGENWVLAFDSRSLEYVGQAFNHALVEKVGVWEGKDFFTMELLFNKILLQPGAKRNFTVEYAVGQGDLDQAVRAMRNLAGQVNAQ